MKKLLTGLLTGNKGVTLIELLVALVISSILLTTIYSVFVTGIHLYQKMQLEGQMRDDADYIATMILNEMYENSPKSVKKYTSTDGTKKGVELVRAREKKVENYIVEDQPEPDKWIFIYFEGGKLFIERKTTTNNEKVEIETPSALIADESSIDLSQVGTCNYKKDECTAGSIDLKLKIHSTEGRIGSMLKTEPLILNSYSCLWLHTYHCET